MVSQPDRPLGPDEARRRFAGVSHLCFAPIQQTPIINIMRFMEVVECGRLLICSAFNIIGAA